MGSITVNCFQTDSDFVLSIFMDRVRPDTIRISNILGSTTVLGTTLLGQTSVTIKTPSNADSDSYEFEAEGCMIRFKFSKALTALATDKEPDLSKSQLNRDGYQPFRNKCRGRGRTNQVMQSNASVVQGMDDDGFFQYSFQGNVSPFNRYQIIKTGDRVRVVYENLDAERETECNVGADVVSEGASSGTNEQVKKLDDAT